MADQRRMEPTGSVPGDTIAQIMHALGHEIDWEVLICLVHQPHPVKRIAEALELSASEVSKSLRRLREHGLVRATRQKTYHFQHINEELMRSLRGSIDCSGRVQHP